MASPSKQGVYKVVEKTRKLFSRAQTLTTEVSQPDKAAKIEQGNFYINSYIYMSMRMYKI